MIGTILEGFIYGILVTEVITVCTFIFCDLYYRRKNNKREILNAKSYSELNKELIELNKEVDVFREECRKENEEIIRLNNEFMENCKHIIEQLNYKGE